MVAFKMKELTIEKFIKEQNYKKQQVIYSIFFFVALAIFLIELMLVKDLSFNSCNSYCFCVNSFWLFSRLKKNGSSYKENQENKKLRDNN